MNSPSLRKELQDLLEGEWPAISPMPIAGTKVVIYGAGNCGRNVARVLKKRGYAIAAFIDARAAAIGDVDGIPSFLPDSTHIKAIAEAGATAGIAVFNNQADLPEIYRLLKTAGFHHIISYYELNEHLAGELDSVYWMTQRVFYKTQTAAIMDGFDVFTDEASHAIYFEIIKLRLTYDPGLLQEPLKENQYFLPQLFKHREPMRIVDGGAYTGDTLEFFLEKQLQIGAVAAFEPDVDNFKRLGDFIKSHGDKIEDAVLFPCGVDEITTTRRFNSSGLSSSAIAESGDGFIQVVALDDALPFFVPTFFKLDIEGAEPAALRGARHMIAKHQPDLAICVYHAPEHLWEIPLYMRSLLPGHKMALRYHQLCGFEVVAYAYRA